VKGNIGKDTILQLPNYYLIPATVLKGGTIILKGISTRGPNFHLQIAEDGGGLLAETDTIYHYPVTQLDTIERWISTVTVNLP
jgi:hypothetical protein